MTLSLTSILPPLIMLAGLWYATPWTATLLYHAPQLTAAWRHLVPWPSSLSWQSIDWFVHDSTVWLDVSGRHRLAVLLGVGRGIACTWIGRLWQCSQDRQPTTFGSSPWAAWQHNHVMGEEGHAL